MTIEEIQAILADPTPALLAALGIPRVCPKLDSAVAFVLRHLTGNDVPVWCDGPWGEVLQVEVIWKGDWTVFVNYTRYPREEGGWDYGGVDAEIELFDLGIDHIKRTLHRVRTDEDWEAVRASLRR